MVRHSGGFSGDGDDAEVVGVVEIEGECLYLVSDEVGERYPVVWPASTSYDGSEGAILLPNGDSVAHGDTVRGGGGYRYVDDVRQTSGDAAAELVSGCLDNTYGEIAVVNNQADAIGRS
ncbi:MAG: hypothetical protein AAGA59_09975 [Actinomycetota bacterium]